jgi:dTDP-glucose 4,6-dehydratase
VAAWAHTYKFPALITRCSNNYGPYQFPEKLIPLMILNALDGKPLPVYGDGKNVRDWIHVEDHCAALDLVLRRGREGEVYNVGGRSERENLHIVRRILELTGKPESLIKFVADRPGHDRRYAIDGTKIERELGFQPSRRLDEALADTVAWYRAHEPWWRAILSGEYRGWYEQNYARRAARGG